MSISFRFLIATLACSVAGYSQVRISQVYGGGGNSGATLTHDFIEVFNAGSSPVSVNGMSVQYASVAGTTWQVTNLPNVMMPAGGYLLVQQAQGTGGTTALPTADAIGTIAMSATGGKVALVSVTTELTGACPTTNVVDFFGFGTANCFEGTVKAALTNTTAAIRDGAGCTDTNNNGTDFTNTTPAPRNSASAANSCSGSTNPSATGTATSVIPGNTSTLSGAITAGTNPASASYTVVCNLTTVGGGASFNLPVTGTAFIATYAVPGSVTPAVYPLPCTVSDNVPRSSNFNISLTVTGATPNLTIDDVSLIEGDAGTTSFTFTVSLSAASASNVTFNIATADNVAIAPGDYTANSLTAQSITDGNTTYSFTVLVNGDTTVEPNETFFVNVTNVVGATVVDDQGQGTIVNDDVAPPTLSTISAIQGSGISSPLTPGSSVTTQGVVTALSSNGYFLQTPDASADNDPNTSEGIFIFTSSAPTVSDGQIVDSTGTVTEFRPSTDPNSRPITELTQTAVTVVSSGNPLPAAVTLPPLTATGGIDQYERFEGMRVQVGGSLNVVAPTSGTVAEANATASSNGVLYTVFPGVAIPTREAGIEVVDFPVNAATACAAGSGCALPMFDANPERLRIDTDGVTGQAAVNVNTGATLSNVIGVMHYAFRAYTILPTAAPTVGGTQISVTSASVPPSNVVTVAAMNVERLFDTVNDPGVSDVAVTPTALAGRLVKMSLTVRNLLRSPEVIALEEVENLSVLQALAAQINSDAVTAGDPNPQYQAFLVEGNDIGGIDVGFLVKSMVTVASVTQLGSALTYLSPCTLVQELLNDRPTLRLRGTSNGLSFSVFVNHLRSLNGVGDTTACTNSTNGARVRAKRAEQANYLTNEIQNELTANPSAKIVVIGDFNAFEVNDGYGDTINAIVGTPAPTTQVLTATADPTYENMTNLLSLMPTAQRYSYVFDGNHQTLDHAILNPGAMSQFVGGGYVRVNADFNEATFRGNFAIPERFSDHDPVYVRLSTGSNVTSQLGVTRTILAYNRGTGLYQSTVKVTNNTAITIAGPLQLVVTGVKDKATLMNATSSTPAGGIYTNLPGSLAPGQSASVLLTFSLRATMPVNFTVNVFAAPPFQASRSRVKDAGPAAGRAIFVALLRYNQSR